jgi:hypothetical protein
MQALPLPHRRKISVTTFVGNANAILPQRRRECTPRGMQLGACNYILLASVWYPCYGVQAVAQPTAQGVPPSYGQQEG